MAVHSTHQKLVFFLKNFLKKETMEDHKIIQLMVACALALGLNGIAVAGSINLNTPVNYTNNSNTTKRFVDYFSFSLNSLSDVIFNYTDRSLLSKSALSLFSDNAKAGPNPINKDTLVAGSVASITGGLGSLTITNIAAGNYYLLVDAFLPKATNTENNHEEEFKYNHEEKLNPSTGNFTLTGYSVTSHVTPVPEPNVYTLMLAGVGLVGFMSYRRQRYFN